MNAAPVRSTMTPGILARRGAAMWPALPHRPSPDDGLISSEEAQGAGQRLGPEQLETNSLRILSVNPMIELHMQGTATLFPLTLDKRHFDSDGEVNARSALAGDGELKEPLMRPARMPL
jgi:hypothetical protein